MKLNSKTIIDRLIITNLILLSGSILSVGYISLLFSFSLLILIISIITSKSILTAEFKTYTFFLFFFIIILLLNLNFSESSTILEYLTFFLRIILGGLTYLALTKRLKYFSHNLYCILKFILIISLIGFVLSQLITGTQIFFPGGFEVSTIYYFHYYASFSEMFGIQINRNSGIFWEPGVFGVFANIFLYLTLFQTNKKSDSILASIVIITTLSTTALFLLCFQWILYIRRNSNLNLFKLSLILVVISCVGFMSYSSIIEKQQESEIEAISSYSLRAFDIISALNIIYEHPIVGIGLNKKVFMAKIYKNLNKDFIGSEDFMESRGNTNSILSLFIVFGIPVALLILKLLYKQNIFHRNKKSFFFIILVSLSSSPLLFTPFFMFLFYSGWRSYAKPKGLKDKVKNRLLNS